MDLLKCKRKKNIQNEKIIRLPLYKNKQLPSKSIYLH